MDDIFDQFIQVVFGPKGWPFNVIVLVVVLSVLVIWLKNQFNSMPPPLTDDAIVDFAARRQLRRETFQKAIAMRVDELREQEGQE